MTNFHYILILLSCSVIFIVTCHRLHMPAIIGYLLVGVLVGPGGLRWLPTMEELEPFAEFGVVFLMFTLGLEFSIPRLIATKRIFVGVGGMQVIICTLVGFLAGLTFGIDVKLLLVISGALALSSTAVVIKQLTEQKQQQTEHGRLAIKILLFQDIAAVCLLVLIPAFSTANSGSLPIAFLITMLKGVGVVIGMALIGLWVLRPLFHAVAKVHSTELFMIATLLTALSAAGITHALGLSMALGAFLAGLMLGETEFKHQIEVNIRAFRDVLLGLFFVVIGAYLQLNKIPEHFATIMAILAFIVLGKMFLIFAVVRLFGRARKTISLGIGIILAHGGEFTFVVLKEAIDYNLMPVEYRPIIFSAVVISLLIAPLLIKFHEQMVELCFKTPITKKTVDILCTQLIEHGAEQQNHVIVCGFSKTGQVLARFLDQEQIPWLSIDLDPMLISKSATAGETVFFGDASKAETLTAAGLARARMVVIAFRDEAASLEVLKQVRSMRLDLPVFVKTKDDSNLESFQKAGATEVVPESLESSIMFASHLLLTLGVAANKVIDKVRKIHAERYENLRGFYSGIDDQKTLEENDNARRSLHSIMVPEGAGIIDHPFSELLTINDAIVVKALNRGTNRISDPPADMILAIGDVIVVFATPEEAFLIEEKVLQG